MAVKIKIGSGELVISHQMCKSTMCLAVLLQMYVLAIKMVEISGHIFRKLPYKDFLIQ